MSELPSISSSAMSALQGGFSLLDRGAQEVNAATQPAEPGASPGDSVEIRSTGSPIEGEPMLAGIRDLMLARMQVGAGAALLHAYNSDRQTLFEMLK